MDLTLATITITKTLTDDDVLVFVDATTAEGETLALVEALIRQSMGDT